jgi:uncharacterized protein involved in type VI secretion and phage assembly
MSQSLLDALLGADDDDDRSDRIYGVVTAVVTNNQDPDKRGRVRVRFPWLAKKEEGESWWARVAAPMAGNGQGAFFLPEVDQEVLVAFEQGDVRFPYVIGALWNANTPPPETNDDGKNNIRSITSRSGAVIRFDDTDGKEKIEIVDAKASVSIVIDSDKGSITVEAGKEVAITAKDGALTLKGKGIVLDSSDAVTVKSSAGMTLEASGPATIKGSTVAIN